MEQALEILVVEDNVIDAKILINILRRCRFVEQEPHLATRLAATRTALSSYRYDIILLDLNLPDATGLDTLEEVIRIAPDIPVVIVTAHEDPDFGVAAVRAGAQDYLVKGRLYQELLERVVSYAIERGNKERELRRTRAEARAHSRELAEHRTRLAELVRERTSALEESYRQLEQFAFVASHDLVEPLRKIRTFGKLLTEEYGGSLDEQGREFLEIMVSAADRMQALITDLLDYSRLDSRKPLTAVPLESCLETAIADLEIAIGEAGATIEHDHLPVVEGDNSLLHRLFLNLLSNGIKYRAADRAPEIRVTAREDDEAAIIEVRDNGIGFDPANQFDIFEPFKRLHLRKDYPGTGIGLAICKKIVALHGGAIEAEGKPGLGSIFRITLPARHEPEGAEICS